MKAKTATGATLLFLAMITISSLFAQRLPEEIRIPGMVAGTGTHFEVTNSAYLNIALDSNKEITVILKSVPQLITIYIEPVSEETSTSITISGLVPSKKYFKYEDDYHDRVEFTSDETGNYSFGQDLSKKHLLFIQETPSTLFIKDDITGGNCPLVGNWDAVTKTCTMTTDLADPVHKNLQIDDSGITLDGAGHTVYSNSGSAGIYSNGTSNLTIKNIKTEAAFAGIGLFNCNNSIITDNTVSNGYEGIALINSYYITVEKNISASNDFGLFMNSSNFNQIRFNGLLYNDFGLYMISSNNNIIVTNAFVDNPIQAINYYGTGNVFNEAKPTGGNYWSEWTTPDTDEDGFVDLPYEFTGGTDYLPYALIIIFPQSDVTPPEITISSPEPNGVYEISEETTIEFSAMDEGSGVASLTGQLSNTGEEPVEVESGFEVTEPGAYTLTVTAQDYADNTAEQSISFVVYDPKAGLSSGGGWFYPDGESSLPQEERAIFAFTARYLRGQSTGLLEFQYPSLQLNLRSKTIDWLVLRPETAAFAGTATINNQGEYTFKVLARDLAEPGAGHDSFDIKIWDPANEEEPLYAAKNTISSGNITVLYRG